MCYCLWNNNITRIFTIITSKLISPIGNVHVIADIFVVNTIFLEVMGKYKISDENGEQEQGDSQGEGCQISHTRARLFLGVAVVPLSGGGW